MLHALVTRDDATVGSIFYGEKNVVFGFRLYYTIIRSIRTCIVSSLQVMYSKYMS
jgi:hypothetical protein